ncbi:unnamed protein product, partial [Mesorhabditis belari]|uniref:Sodium/hydrogen exchanger n=1 Tax=Mesorhabditis belari TaxID=2138241 RepID=A0AAF3FKX9_9BILA
MGWRSFCKPKNFLPYFLILLVKFVTAEESKKKKFQILELKYEEIKEPMIIVLWIIFAASMKILFNHVRFLSKYIPDSALLIVVGLAIGGILKAVKTSFTWYSLESTTFFLFILPPIIFDAGYFMPNRALFENAGSVLLFSVVGTLFNTFAIGLSLYGLLELGIFGSGFEFSLFEILLFAALISAVDPVAVIAVFEEIHVNEFLFINVFGEALFNDGVTVVLYQMFKSFTEIGASNLVVGDYFQGAASFFVVAIGGIVIGLLFAMLTAIFTKYTQNIKILAPLFIFLLPYSAYLFAEMVSLSPILAISFCGMFMKQYVKGNISMSAQTSVKYFTKMLAQSSETVVFVFLGLSTISSKHKFDWAFIGATLACCLIFRTIGVVSQCFVLNKFRTKKFTMVDQFILSYGGLRGAIAFGLASSMPDTIAAKPYFITTTICVIYFTVFLQGITIKPLVDCLSVETRDGRAKTMAEAVYGDYMDHLMSGLEVIAGVRGHNSFRAWFDRINNFYLKPFLMKDHHQNHFDAGKIMRAFTKITLHEALEAEVGDFHSPRSTPATTIVQSTMDSSDPNFAYNNEGYVAETSKRKLSRKHSIGEILRDKKNVDMLCEIFSEMLDKKLEASGLKEKLTVEHDIADDYIQGVERHEIKGQRREDLHTDAPVQVVSVPVQASSQKPPTDKFRWGGDEEATQARREEFRAQARKKTSVNF